MRDDLPIETTQRLQDIGKDAWQALAPAAFPFASFDYLEALETSGAVGPGSGWSPHYFTAKDGSRVVGAAFLYGKTNSYGEYIFDWAWAEAYRRYGVPYYPKLTGAVPFTPATGPKLLLAPDADRAQIAASLIDAAKALAAGQHCSSLHYLFITPEETALFAAAGLLIRHSFQYHWKNRGYRDFEDFLDALRPRKSKQIRRERAQLQEAGLDIKLLTGATLQPEHADVFYRFYRATIEKMGAIPYLSLAFFRTVFVTMRDQVVLLLAEEAGTPIAGALFYRQGPNLYGRYWGTVKDVRNLHFELCYYRALEWAIAERIELFEAGAQGEHKIARGFLPELTYSAHWLEHAGFRDAIGGFIEQEKAEIARLFAELERQQPYMRGP
jgi:predicted N-acyltransferase